MEAARSRDGRKLECIGEQHARVRQCAAIGVRLVILAPEGGSVKRRVSEGTLPADLCKASALLFAKFTLITGIKPGNQPISAHSRHARESPHHCSVIRLEQGGFRPIRADVPRLTEACASSIDVGQHGAKRNLHHSSHTIHGFPFHHRHSASYLPGIRLNRAA